MAHWIRHIALSFLAFLHLLSAVLGILMIHATVYYSQYDEGTSKSDYVPLYLGVSLKFLSPGVDFDPDLLICLYVSYSHT